MRTIFIRIKACMTIISIRCYRKIEIGAYLPKGDPKLLVESCLSCGAIKNSPSGAAFKLSRSISCAQPSSARVEDLMNCSDAITTAPLDAYLCYPYYRLHIISTGGYRKLEVVTYLPKDVRWSSQLFSTIQQLLLTDYIPVNEEF